VRSIDPQVPLADVKSMQEVVATTLARPRTVSVLLSAFALMALVLAAVGVYGVMAYSVSQRTREIGVRMALGATPDSVFRLVLGHALRLVLAGVAGGLLAAAALTRMLGALLFQTGPLDAATFAGTALILLLVATFASLIPARRGTRITPVEALRAD
jgi:putative ABC transport system permease protein